MSWSLYSSRAIFQNDIRCHLDETRGLAAASDQQCCHCGGRLEALGPGLHSLYVHFAA